MTSRPLARARTVGLALALAGGGLLLAPTPAEAGVLDTPTTQVAAAFSASGTCTLSGPGNTSSNNTFAADGASVVTSAASSATYTKTGDPTDVTAMTSSYTQKVTVTQANNSLKTFDVQSSGAGTLNPSKGAAQTCAASLQSVGTNIATFDTPSPKILTIDIKAKDMVGLVAIVSTPNPSDGEVLGITYNLHSKLHQTFYLPAGHWTLQNQNAVIMQAPTPTSSQPSSRNGTASVHIDFGEPGSATTASSGDGKKYVDLAAGRNCAAGTLTATFKNKAGKGDHRTIKKATFYVNDVKVASVKKPKKKSTKVLTGLSSDDAADVRVKLKLAKKGAGSKTVERSYLTCT
jgi:hypothetical protein